MDAVRRLLVWLGGVVAGIAAYGLLRRRREPPPEPGAAGLDPRADELRAKLEATSSVELGSPAAEPGPEPADPDLRRSLVHEEARSAIDEMRGERD
jgi:hypothetical protein